MANSTSINPTLTADQVERILVKPLVQQSTYLSAGFPVFTSNGEPIKIPSLDSFGTPGYIAQGSAIDEVSASTSEIELLPSTVWSIKTITRVSNELVRQAVVNIESEFSMKLVSDVARVLDSAMWNGAGTAGAPLGMANFTGYANAGTVAGTAIVSADLFAVQEVAMENYLDLPRMTWAMSPLLFTKVRLMADNYGGRILQPSLAAGAPGTILGSPYIVTKHLPDTAVLLFDRSQVAVGMDSRASVSISPDAYFDTDEVAIRVTARYDTAPLNPTAVVKLAIT